MTSAENYPALGAEVRLHASFTPTSARFFKTYQHPPRECVEISEQEFHRLAGVECDSGINRRRSTVRSSEDFRAPRKKLARGESRT